MNGMRGEHEMNEGHSLDGAGGGRVQKVRVSEGGWIVDGFAQSLPAIYMLRRVIGTI